MPAQRHITMRTTRDIPTRSALDSRRIRTSCTKKQNLSAVRQSRSDTLNELKREIPRHSPLSPFRRSVNDFHIRIGRAVISFRKIDFLHPPDSAIVEGLQRRSCSPEDNLRPVNTGQHQCSITPIISWCRSVLLIRGIMFLIHDYQSQVMVRQEYRRTRTKHYVISRTDL